ncbi:MAG: hypothetical protein WC761_00270 [Candidatus Paceibacterota bacterium]|jgi:hypothetical protein
MRFRKWTEPSLDQETKRRIREAIDAAAANFLNRTANAVIGATGIGYNIYLNLKWWPNVYMAKRFFEEGKIYQFRENPVWLTLWKDRSSKTNPDSKALCRMKPGSVFIILGTERISPDHLILNVLLDEQAGFLVLLGEDAMEPWTVFDRIHADDK